MSNKNDKALIDRYVLACSREHLTIKEMGEKVGRTKGWASALVNGRIGGLQFQTRNRILTALGEL